MPSCMHVGVYANMHAPEVDTECISHLPSALVFETGSQKTCLIEPEVPLDSLDSKLHSRALLSLPLQCLNYGYPAFSCGLCVGGGVEFRSYYLRSKHFTHRDISPVSDSPFEEECFRLA